MADPNTPKKPEAPAGGIVRTPRRARKKKAALVQGRQKEVSYRGYSAEELATLGPEEVLAIVPSRVRRMIKRGLGTDGETFLANVKEAGPGEMVKTHLREFPILPALVGKTIGVHDGKEFKRVDITMEMVGHKLGEFALTRKAVKHTGPGVGATRSSKFMPLK
ncbi:MAG TPA: 30S ribosomal protein S19 [Candidatus Thermoplasmatota archaeon]|nr:30S ribosomal protein S19 [Candidatus Thermoplasmatota archaeon]